MQNLKSILKNMIYRIISLQASKTIEPTAPDLLITGSYKNSKKKSKQYLERNYICNHSLRKSFIELANKRGLSPVYVAKSTGHSTIQMIKYYDTTEELADNASDDIGDFLLNLRKYKVKNPQFIKEKMIFKPYHM